MFAVVKRREYHEQYNTIRRFYQPTQHYSIVIIAATMKFSAFAVLATLVTGTSALAPPNAAAATNSGRRAFLTNAASVATMAAAAAPAMAASQYSLELDETYKKEAPEKKKSGNGGTLVGAALGGGLLLSLPFFAPNLARLAGVKNAKIKDGK